MADAFLQDLLAGAVVDGQVNADLGDGDAAHHAVYIQDLFVIFGQRVAAAGHKGVVHGVPGKVFVVFFGQGPLFGQGGLVLGFNGGLVGLHNAGLVFLRQPAADERVGKHGRACQKQYDSGGKRGL